MLNYFNNYETANVDFSLMKLWLNHSLINGVFRSRGAGWIPYKTGIKKILESIKTNKNKEFPIVELFKVYITHPITFTTKYTSGNLDQLDSSFVYYLIYDRARITRINDVDHIMPKNILEAKGFDLSKINSIKNSQLLDFGTNRGTKNGKSFKEWVNNPVYVKDKPTYVALHLMPSDETLWTEDKFEDFIEARATLILGKLGGNVN